MEEVKRLQSRDPVTSIRYVDQAVLETKLGLKAFSDLAELTGKYDCQDYNPSAPDAAGEIDKFWRALSRIVSLDVADNCSVMSNGGERCAYPTAAVLRALCPVTCGCLPPFSVA